MIEYSLKKGSIPIDVILIHGNSSNTSVFESLINNIKFNYNAYCIDLPGHNPQKRPSFEREIDISCVIEELKELLNSLQNPIFLIGHSLGGHLAIEIAPYIKNIQGICIFGTPPIEVPINLEKAFNPTQEMLVLFEENPSDLQLDNFLEKALVNMSVKNRVKMDFNKVNKNVRTAIASAIPKSYWNNQKEIFKHLNVPKYILHGAKDPFVNSNYLKEIEKSDKNCQLIVLESCGHYPQLEVPEEFEKCILYFLEKIISTKT